MSGPIETRPSGPSGPLSGPIETRPSGPSGPLSGRRSIFTRLYHGETNFNFIAHTRRWFTISLVVIGVGLLSLLVRGLNLGIEFEGGTVWEVPTAAVSVSDARSALEPLGLGGASIQTAVDRQTGEQRLRVSAEPQDTETVNEVANRLADEAGLPVDDVSINSVGPSWGEEISRKALRALIIFLVLITIYISFRFEFKMAIPTLAAMIHDLLITVGVYSLTGFEVTPATVIAILTILGYSIYDGIVVFDKVDENTRMVGAGGRSLTYGDMVNLSLNQTLMRSLNTTITAVLPILSLLVIGSFLLGARTLQEFALALLIGLTASAYSSIFVASPLLAILKEREPRYRDIRRRIETRVDRGPITERREDVAEPVKAAVAVGERPAAASPARAATSIPPRPRKKGRRR